MWVKPTRIYDGKGCKRGASDTARCYTRAMSESALRDKIARIPDAAPSEDLEVEIADSVRYLASDDALRSIERDPYWPKWHSPWWHMLLLFELGEARRIPARAAAAMVDGLNALPVKVLPIRPEDAVVNDRWRDYPCHCALGSMDRVLTACGIDVDTALPWAKPWFVRYQMGDGGLNCDESAYLCEDECPSSMVATIAPFDAMLREPWTAEQRQFLERAAAFLIARKLQLGSSSAHNAREREREAGWLAPTFPRFYYYDVLRGLAALVAWSERSAQTLPRQAIEGVVDHLVTKFPDGVIRIQRKGFAICPRTHAQNPDGTWSDHPTSSFPLLDASSAIGRPSAALTRQWAESRRGLSRLIDAGRVVD